MIGEAPNAQIAIDRGSGKRLLQDMLGLTTDPFLSWQGDCAARAEVEWESSGAGMLVAASGSSSPVYYGLSGPTRDEGAVSWVGTVNRLGNAFHALPETNEPSIGCDLASLFHHQTSDAKEMRVAWKWKIEPSRPSSSPGSRNPNHLTFSTSPVRRGAGSLVPRESRGFSSTARLVAPISEIDAARKEIEDLLNAMSRGEPLNRSEDVMILSSRLAEQLQKPAEAEDVTSWSEKLAADLGKFRD